MADAEQGRPAADHAAGRLVGDLALGQGLLQFGLTTTLARGKRVATPLSQPSPLEAADYLGWQPFC